MTTFNVVFEIQVEENSPIKAAQKVQDWIKTGGRDWQFYVQNDHTRSVHSVDLTESADEVDQVVFDYRPLID